MARFLQRKLLLAMGGKRRAAADIGLLTVNAIVPTQSPGYPPSESPKSVAFPFTK